MLPYSSSARDVGRAGSESAVAGVARGDSVALMRNPVKSYDWGCLRGLAELQGRVPSGGPEAELWMGAHPSGASHLLYSDGRELNLADAVSANPLEVLGIPCVKRFGPRLPFMLKVLAIEKALSVQVHPDGAQAAAGHADEEARGVPPDSPARRYVDPFGKPEQFVALTTVHALAGLREPEQAARFLGLLHLDALMPLAETAAHGSDRALVALAQDAAAFLPDIAARCRHAATTAMAVPAVKRDPEAREALACVVRLAAEHPADPLVLAPLLMHVRTVRGGQSLFVPSGTPHAYLEGLAVEVMGASDNVARAGLTTKRVDAALFRDWLRPDAVAVYPQPLATAPGVTAWRTPQDIFSLAEVTVRGRGRVPVNGPSIILAVSGSVVLGSDDHSLTVQAGQSVFVDAGAPSVWCEGNGRTFVATVADPM